jgi:integrase
VIRVLSRDEAGRFLAACELLVDVRPHPIGFMHSIALRTLLLTGLRRGELLALHDEDVDLTAAVITIRHGKFGKARYVPITPDLMQRLRAYREAVSRAITSPRPTSPFFPRPNGQQPLACQTLYRSFRKTLELAGIKHSGRGEGPRLHDLRHYAGFRIMPGSGLDPRAAWDLSLSSPA